MKLLNRDCFASKDFINQVINEGCRTISKLKEIVRKNFGSSAFCSKKKEECQNYYENLETMNQINNISLINLFA